MPTASPAQRDASNPAQSVWVNANAGSGKTTVLVDRVVRLMLSGADPARILCVTFTKAAAANMQDRIFSRLGAWAALSDATLTQEIAEMTGAAPNPAQLKVARRLFARAVETPGGLKVQTIHAFAERLLHNFPFEAAIPARFEIFDEAEAAAVLARATAGTLRAALADKDSELAAALRTATDAAGEDGVRKALSAFVAERRKRDGLERKFAASPLRAALGVAAGETSDVARTRILGEGLPTTRWREVADWLAGGTRMDAERAAELRAALETQGAPDGERYADIFRTSNGEKRKSLATKGLSTAQPDLAQVMLEEQERVFAVLDRLRAVTAAERSEAIVRLADDVLARYRAEKRRLGRLDFADLIDKARALLTSDASRWVLWKLDQGVDHILVDEAQDTSPEQWDIVKALSDDFFAGAGARGALTRTIFAVGDEKQSIFGFQGAKPEAFDAARRHYKIAIDRRNAEASRPHVFTKVDLQLSYRSTGDVLTAVDKVFSLPEHFQGLEAENRKTIHQTNRASQPGLVELWDPEEPEKTEDDPDAPVDALPSDNQYRRLASRIARRIRHWMDERTRLEGTGLPITPGDVLVLVRSRGPVFDEVIRALKAARVPVAGADRMKLLDQIAVLDLLSLGRFCLLQEDDLALAEVLKSPIVGLSDENLEAVAAERGDMSLWNSLRARCAAAATMLQPLLDLASTADPLRFYATALSAGGLRRRLVRRLGPDAAEAIDVFLYRLRQWQAANPPSLRLFIEAVAGDESDVKRDMEEAHGRVRVMTVHGSKGLEAPVVFLADLFKPAGGGKGPVLIEAAPGDPDTAVWTPRKADDPWALAEGRAHVERLEAEEHRRLLYVALTRAADRLYIAGARPARESAGHWHGMIEAALGSDAGLTIAADEAEPARRVRQWRTVKAPPVQGTEGAQAEAAPPPFDWIRKPAPADLPRPPPIRPSRLSDAAEPPPLRETMSRRFAARLRGDLIHLLFQHLPDVAAERRRSVGAALAAARFGGLPEEARAEALESVLRITDDPRWADLFSQEARAEADIAGRVSVGGRLLEVAGRIDRLLIAPDIVTVLDYKTGRPPEDLALVTGGHLRQLAVYRALAQDLYPGRTVRAAVLWTAVPAIVALDDAALDRALAALAL
jgi:ATP-dependent helicase/nuclease subunit A